MEIGGEYVEKGFSLNEIWVGTSVICSLVLFVFGFSLLIIGLYFKMKKKKTVGVLIGSISMIVSTFFVVAVWFMSSKML